ncbi:MAG: hypothetical protein A3I61_06885 [Acidobacteria bacterium RIFCSPLOWO2_02_FULL_68_18]|nr:MAG: hypothetical protein A3I61_06885 [Acidobacteria bacterium RIFCSPLOWO2_02_FULL_68_18]OFW48791.1 MAG: hypothetical protein A3G77_17750 [Acidobacteria bacterium RIFCSPLOWO2_12_FULL_68_19]
MQAVLIRFFTAALFLTAAAVPTFAQATGELAGRVTDESGGVLPGVTVAATQTDTGFTRSVVTDGQGNWVMPNMPTGPYRLEVSLQGFRTYVQTGIVLQVGATPTLNVVLAVGSLEETVSVEAAAPIIDVRSAGISDVVENDRILELPLQGRQVTNLIVLAGGAVQTDTSSSRAMRGGVSISVAGGLPFGVAYLLDGAMHNNPQDNSNMPMPFPDALQEFSVATSGLSAQHGMHSGASVSAVTRSGTNSFHGNAFEFLRDRRLNATDPFAAVGPDGRRRDDGLQRNQFGGTFGGPIVRDRMFFFGGYQETTIRRRPSSNFANVPTPAMLAGDFTTFASPLCNGGRQMTLRAPFVNNRVDRALLSPAAVSLTGRLPKSDHPCGEVQYESAENSDEGQAIGRLDYQWTANHSLFGRYMATYFQQPAPFSQTGNVLTTADAPGLDNLAQSLAVGDTLVFGSNMVNALRFTFNRTAIDRGNPPFFDPKAVGSNVYSYNPGEMVIAVTGGFNISAGTSTKGVFTTNASQVSDDLTLVRGNHQIGLGASVAYWKMNFLTHARSGGNWQFTGQLTGLGLADFLLGRVGRLEHGGPGLLPMDQWHVGTYVQDTWRVTTRVTLNAGLRWEPFFGANVLNDAIYNFRMDNFRNNVRSRVFLNAPAGFIYPGDDGFPEGQSGLNAQWFNFSPRAGIAWDVQGDGRTAVRASYGLAYDFPTAEYHNINAQAPPWGNRSLVEDPPGRFDNPYAHLGGDPHPIVAGPNTAFIPFGAFGATDPDINSPRIQQWNVTVERQIAADWGVAVSYLGSYSDRLWGQVQRNPGVFLGLGPCVIGGVSYPVCSTAANLNQRRVLSLSSENSAAARLIGNLDVHTDIGTQEYRGLRLSMRRRSTTGVALNANYTVSRCFGSNTTGGFPQLASGYTNPDNPDFDDGYCDQDRTHVGNLTLGYQTPEVGSGALGALGSNWRISGILNARSGRRLNIIAGRDVALTGIQQQRVNQVSSDVYGDKTINSYLNRAAFAFPDAGTLGNYRRNSITGPGFQTIDVAVSRLASFGAQTLEFRVEAFNVLNTFNWGDPVVNLNSGLFGRIQSMTTSTISANGVPGGVIGAPRIFQFGVKYGF